MKNTRRIVTGLLLAATLAVSLLATGSDAYAKVRAGGGQLATDSGGTITVPTTPDLFQTLGITWE
jgi:hypothetical protein